MQIPDLLPYPPIFHLDNMPELKDRMVYIVKEYEQNGIAVLITNINDEIRIKFGDWDGNNVEFNEKIIQFMQEYNEKIIEILRIIGVTKCILYMTNDLILVDVRLSLNKFSGPGMVRDLFGKVIPTQETVKVEILDDQTLESIHAGVGIYSCNLIIKTSTFGTVVRDNELIPSYAIVTRI